MSDVASSRRRLRDDWLLTAVLYVLSLLVGVAGVAGLADPATAARWAVPAAGVIAFELWFLGRNLDANHLETETDGGTEIGHERLGLPNAVTLVRGGCFAGVAGFVAVAPTPTLTWLPGVFYGLGAFLDGVDGALARRNGRTTLLGARLDMAFDTLGFLVAPVVAVLWGRLPVWYLSLSAARYLFKALRGLRRSRGNAVYDLPESRLRRQLAGLQMVFITVALTPLFSPQVIAPLAAVVLLPSLAMFARDYLVVAGVLAR